MSASELSFENLSISDRQPTQIAQPAPLAIKDKIDEVPFLESQQVLYILQSAKYMQRRMKEPGIKGMPFANQYDTLSKDKNLDHFFNRYTGIFIKVLENKPRTMAVLAGNLYFMDQKYKGNISESQLANILSSKYMTEEQKKDSDEKMAEEKEKEDKKAAKDKDKDKKKNKIVRATPAPAIAEGEE